MALPVRKQQRLPDIFDWFESVPPFLGWRSMEHLRGLRVEEYTDGGDFVVRAEVPGVDPDKGLDVSVDHGVLTIHAERGEEKADKDRSEFRYGSFSRSVPLPDGADEDSTSASYNDGILTVRITMGSKPKEAKKVAIQHSA